MLPRFVSARHTYIARWAGSPGLDIRPVSVVSYVTRTVVLRHPQRMVVIAEDEATGWRRRQLAGLGRSAAMRSS